MLTAALAQEIAEDTSAVIGFNVLITDSEGTIIGSGDRARVGQFHEASVEVMRTLQLATHGSTAAHELRGVRPGITLPLVIDGQAVGTVGITGAPASVRRFGLVVRRQIEILLQESALLRSRLQTERARDDLLRDIAFYDPAIVELDLVLSRAAELGYRLELRRVVVVVDTDLAPPPGAHQRRGRLDISVLRSELLLSIRQVFADRQDVIASVASARFGVLHRVPHVQTSEDEEAAVTASCEAAVRVLEAHHGVVARAAFGGVATSVGGLHDSYEDASDALRLGARLAPQLRVHSIGSLRIHQVLSAVGHRSRAHLGDALLGSLRTQADWPVLRETIVAWCENGFSLVRTAAALHVHRNTLVYRLAKIEQLRARSMRDHRNALALYLACLAERLDESG